MAVDVEAADQLGAQLGDLRTRQQVLDLVPVERVQRGRRPQRMTGMVVTAVFGRRLGRNVGDGFRRCRSPRWSRGSAEAPCGIRC
ncbi:hypothetical protein [Paractinoplanes durhamensis]|uniref:hypothetical protein n=1 Tax=Paractinoplanes durhamensis TaxID=113563 RepID=UPI0019438288|nr:hypothetical protein [Actinoplanes durhamensis]